MLIRRERAEDVEPIRRVHREAFDPPAAGEQPVEVALLDALRADGDLVDPCCLVAELDGEVVGHVAVSHGSVEGAPEARVVGLGPIGVLPAHQGEGVGAALMHATLAAADALGVEGVVLLGHETWYPRFGFTPAAPEGLGPSDPTWPSVNFMLRRLHAWSGPRGTFHYAPAFARL